MDEMKMKLSTKFMKNVAAKLIATIIRKKYGYEVDIQLNDLDVSVIDGEAKISVNVEAKLEREEFMEIMKTVVGLE